MGHDDPLAGAIARIRGRRGEIVGVAFLATSDLLVTCAHVVSAAAGTTGPADDPPADPVSVDFPLLGGPGAPLRAEVVGWQPARPDGTGDTAVLRIGSALPPGAWPVPLRPADARWGEAVRLYGFPADLPEDFGVWVGAELRARQGAGWLQIEAAPGARRIGPGFSGSPVWSAASGAVVGMVVAADRLAGSTTGYLLPAGSLLQAHPVLGEPDPAEVCPYRGLDPFLAEHAAFFRGRDRLVGELAALVDRQPLVVVAGPSGSGKSSLVHAGLVPRLRRRGILVADFRPVPGVRPSALLAGALLPVLEPGEPGLARRDQVQALARWLDQGQPEVMPWLAAAMLTRVGAAGLFVVADQFEELGAATARELFGLLRRLVRALPRRPGEAAQLRALVTARSATLDVLVSQEPGTPDAAAQDADLLPRALLLVPPMDRAELRTAVTHESVGFEPGLVDRILDDARQEPGRLPLVEFTLTQLWTRRSAATLTHRAYDEIGGISGALARYAERVYQDDLDAAEQDLARRLFARMVAVDPDGGTVRRPLRLADLDEAATALIGKLAASRLVVIGRTLDGDEIADVAHQALLEQWGRLRGWLDQDREFLTWHHQVRQDAARWQSAERDRGALLRGTALTLAARWLRDRPDDLGGPERDYIRHSQAGARRRRRFARSIVAGIAALALVAATLAVVARSEAATAQARLRSAASRALADDANRFRAIDPAVALQLAQAAWHHDHTAEAYGALLSQYAALQGADRIRTDLWQGEATDIQASRDGRVVAVTADSGLPFVWLDLSGSGTPTRWTPHSGAHPHPGGTFALSQDGRKLAYANGSHDVLTWDVGGNGAPTVVAVGSDQGTKPPVVNSMAFDAQGDRLLVGYSGYGGEDPFLEEWDLVHHTKVPVSARAVQTDFAPTAAFGPVDGTAALDDGFDAMVVDLATGHVVRRRKESDGNGAIAVSGSMLVECAADFAANTNTVFGLDLFTGAVRWKTLVPDCGTFAVDRTSNYGLIVPHTDAGDSSEMLTAIALDTGRAYRFVIPPQELTSENGVIPVIACYRGANGNPVALVGDRDILYRVPAVPVSDRLPGRPLLAPGDSTSSPDGRYSISIARSGTITVRDPHTTRVLATYDGPRHPQSFSYQGRYFAFGFDYSSLLVVEGDQLTAYGLPDLRVRQRMPLPVPPPSVGTATSVQGFDQWASSLVPVREHEVVVLHAGILTRWNPDTGAEIGTPLPLRTDPAGELRSAFIATLSPTRRVGHPEQVAVLQSGGWIELWNLDRRTVDQKIDVDAQTTSGNPVFDVTGSRLAILTTAHELLVWDIERHHAAASPIAVGDVEGVLGFTRSAQVITVDQLLDTDAKIWDLPSGKLLATLNLTEGAVNWTLAGSTLSAEDNGYLRSIDLDPERWFGAMCRLSNRPYTDREREVLARDSADSTSPPCG